VKKTNDLTLGTLGLILFSPVLTVVALAVYLSMGRPVLFRQLRSGYRARPFTIYKFRTMRDARSPDGNPLPDAERLTRVGRFLRKTSLDELPQLWNVILGQLSVVGPRPRVIEYLSLYTRDQARRLEVKPGITGWAQVNGRNSIDWNDKFRYDVWYVDHWSPLLDARILLRTVATVLRREGITGHGVETVVPFRGSVVSEA